MNDINDATGRETAARITESGGRAIFVHADVARDDDVRRLVDTAVSTYGRLDGAVNNAGVEATGLVAEANGMFQRLFETTSVSKKQVLAVIPARRSLRPGELCAAVCYLLADDSRYMVGHTLALDGGFTAQ